MTTMNPNPTNPPETPPESPDCRVRDGASSPSEPEKAADSGGGTPSPTAPSYDMSIHSNPDARAWAALFVKTIMEVGDRLTEENNLEYTDLGIAKAVLDEGYMIGWFANAMMAMHDHLAGKAQREAASAPPAPAPEVATPRTKDVLSRFEDTPWAVRDALIAMELETIALRAERDEAKRLADTYASISDELGDEFEHLDEVKEAIVELKKQRDSWLADSAEKDKRIATMELANDALNGASLDATEECNTLRAELAKVSAERDALRERITSLTTELTAQMESEERAVDFCIGLAQKTPQEVADAFTQRDALAFRVEALERALREAMRAFDKLEYETGEKPVKSYIQKAANAARAALNPPTA